MDFRIQIRGAAMKHYLLTLLLIFSPLFSQSQSPTLISDRNIVFERPSSQKDGNPTNFSVPHRYLTQGMHPYLQTVFSGCFADEKCHLLHPYTQHSLDLLKSTLRVIYNADKNFKVIHGKDAQTPPSVFEKDLHALFIRKLNAATIMDFIVLIDEVHLTMCHNPLAEVLCAVTDPEDIVDKILNDPGITFHNDFMQSIKKFLILYHADNEKVVAFRKKEADISCSLQEAFQTRMKTHPTREFLYKNYQDEDDNTSERSYTLNLTADVPNSYALEYFSRLL